MRRLLALACLLSLSALAGMAPTAAMAQDGPWRISAREGVVRVASPGQAPRDAQANEAVAIGATVTTGGQSRAVVENGVQRISMSANSRITIAPDSTDAMTRILQDVGAVLFQVDRRDAQHFRVEAPLLAAVVKGTTFTVSAGPQQDVVHVAKGLVEVRANDGGSAIDVAAGGTAQIARLAPGTIALAIPQASAKLPPQISVPPVDYSEASHGVIASLTSLRGLQSDARHMANEASAVDVLGADPASASLRQSIANAQSATAAVAQAATNGGNGNSNAGGNGNSNAGGNGNSDAGGNGSSNAGGNSNSNAGGNGNSNAGGNGNSNAGGNGNSNAGGNGNSNAGNGNGSAGGNGNSNAGGNGNGSAGGNGNGNAGGNGNSNAGGNGNGKGSGG